MLSTAFALQGFEHIVRTTDAQHYTCLPIFTLSGVDGYPHARDGRHQGTQGDRSHETRTPVILMTAYAEVETPSKRYAAGPSTMLSNRLISRVEFNRSARFTTPVNEKRDPHLHQALSTSWQWGHILTNSPR